MRSRDVRTKRPWAIAAFLIGIASTFVTAALPGSAKPFFAAIAAIVGPRTIDVARGAVSGAGIYVKGGRGHTIRGNMVRGYRQGVVIEDSEGNVIERNDTDRDDGTTARP